MEFAIYDKNQIEKLQEIEIDNLGLTLNLHAPDLALCKLNVEPGVSHSFYFESEEAFYRICSEYSFYKVLCKDLNLSMLYSDFKIWLKKSSIYIKGNIITEDLKDELEKETDSSFK